MDYRLYYRHAQICDRGYLEDKKQLVGHFQTDVRPLDAIPNAVEWFANLREPTREIIESFGEKYGLLRWNWTQEGWGGSQADQFYFSVDDFRESHKQFLSQWVLASSGRKEKIRSVCEWISDQLASRSKVGKVHKFEKMWKLSQPNLEMRIRLESKGMGGVEVQLLAGDLWQALCWEFLTKLTERHGQIRVCKNKLCAAQRYFLGTTKYCNPNCGKRVADREYVRKKRARIRPQNGSSSKGRVAP
jgi:hypothetical protein